MALTAFIIGAGENVGKAVALKLISEGYKVVIGSRTGKEVTGGKASALKLDVGKEEEVVSGFAEATKTLGSAPNVVIFNAAAFTPAKVEGEPFSVPYASFVKDQTVGGFGGYASIQQAIAGWKTLSTDAPKVFIATSNLLGVQPAPPIANFLSLGTQKRILEYLVEYGIATHKKDGYRFYLPSQVGADGGYPGPDFNGDAHAAAYWRLIQEKEQGELDVRFVKDGSLYEKK